MDDLFPVEIIIKIIHFLDVVDIVRVRMVSRKLREITYDGLIWRDLYPNSPLPRPPGPFPSQSNRYLEDTLIHSARSGKSWPTHQVSEVSKEFMIESSIMPKMIFRGWCITIESYKWIVLHNIDSGGSRQIVVEHGLEHGQMLSWSTCSITSPEGQRVYVILSDQPYSQGKLLEFRADVDSGHLEYCASLDIPVMTVWPAARIMGDKPPFLYLSGHRLVFDMRTRVFYRFPKKAASQPDETAVLLTSTHIIAVYFPPTLPGHGLPATTTMQAFVIPSGPIPNENRPGVLRLTHEGTIRDRILPISLLRNSVTDPRSGATNVRFLRQRNETLFSTFFCVNLTLPESLPGVVQPIYIDPQPIFRVDVSISQFWDGNVFVEASDDGHARGLYASNARHATSRSVFHVSKFTVDATGDKCVGVVGKPLPLGWKHFSGPQLVDTAFDGVRGRLYSFQVLNIRDGVGQYVSRSLEL